jgi:hypothetical protein
MKEKLIYITGRDFTELETELSKGWQIKNIAACTSNGVGRCYVWVQYNPDNITT